MDYKQKNAVELYCFDFSSFYETIRLLQLFEFNYVLCHMTNEQINEWAWAHYKQDKVIS